MSDVTEADRERARKYWLDARYGEVEEMEDVIAQVIAAERERVRAPFLALAQELATVACDHHATVAGDAYADAADRIMAVLDGTYL